MEPILAFEKLTFGVAIAAMKDGMRVSRVGWNGPGQFVYIRFSEDDGHGNYIEISPVNGVRVPWLASQTDMLAEDWYVV